ncbi:hypothetical protein, partial [Azospirillum picis]
APSALPLRPLFLFALDAFPLLLLFLFALGALLLLPFRLLAPSALPLRPLFLFALDAFPLLLLFLFALGALPLLPFTLGTFLAHTFLPFGIELSFFSDASPNNYPNDNEDTKNIQKIFVNESYDFIDYSDDQSTCR